MRVSLLSIYLCAYKSACLRCCTTQQLHSPLPDLSSNSGQKFIRNRAINSEDNYLLQLTVKQEESQMKPTIAQAFRKH